MASATCYRVSYRTVYSSGFRQPITNKWLLAVYIAINSRDVPSIYYACTAFIVVIPKRNGVKYDEMFVIAVCDACRGQRITNILNTTVSVRTNQK